MGSRYATTQTTTSRARKGAGRVGAESHERYESLIANFGSLRTRNTALDARQVMPPAGRPSPGRPEPISDRQMLEPAANGHSDHYAPARLRCSVPDISM